MKILFLAIAFCAAVCIPVCAKAEPGLYAFSGTVKDADAHHVYRVTLYAGNGKDANFNAERKLLAVAATDADGHFVLPATNLPAAGALTVRAINVALRMAGQAILDKPDSGWDQVSGGIEIAPALQTDYTTLANYGIRNNRYASANMVFVTDRQFANGSFANTAAAGEAPSAGSFMAHVALGNGQAVPGKCGIAPDWSCAAPPTLQDDAFVDHIKVLASGDSAHTVLSHALQTMKAGSAVVLFVHGYNNSFEQGAEKAARLSYLVDPLPHLTVLYSWPSQQQVLGYPQDIKSADLSAKKNLVWVLDELAAAPHHPRIILAAHSMGSYALTTALYEWATQHPSQSGAFSDLALFAGDLDADLWTGVYQEPVSHAVKRIKFYANANDQALQMSMCTTGDKRKRVGQQTVWTAPVTAFDATKFASTNGFGHGYLVESTSVAQDWNKWIDGNGNSASGIRRLSWLGDGGGSLVNAGKLASAALCGIVSRIHF